MKCLVKINVAKVMKRLDREASEAWGLNQDKANKAEEALLRLCKAQPEEAMRLVRLGYLSPLVISK